MVTTKAEFLTPREAAKELNVARCTIYRWLKHGWLVAIRLPNGTRWIPRAQVERIMAGK